MLFSLKVLDLHSTIIIRTKVEIFKQFIELRFISTNDVEQSLIGLSRIQNSKEV